MSQHTGPLGFSSHHAAAAATWKWHWEHTFNVELDHDSGIRSVSSWDWEKKYLRYYKQNICLESRSDMHAYDKQEELPLNE